MISRLTQKEKLVDAISELFDRSLFSEAEFYSMDLQALKPILLEKADSVLDLFYYDFEKSGFRKLIQRDEDSLSLNAVVFCFNKTIQYVDDIFLITRFKMWPDWQAQNLVTDFRRYAIILIIWLRFS